MGYTWCFWKYSTHASTSAWSAFAATAADRINRQHVSVKTCLVESCVDTRSISLREGTEVQKFIRIRTKETYELKKAF